MTSINLTRDQLVEIVYESCMWKLAVIRERLDDRIERLNEGEMVSDLYEVQQN